MAEFCALPRLPLSQGLLFLVLLPSEVTRPPPNTPRENRLAELLALLSFCLANLAAGLINGIYSHYGLMCDTDFAVNSIVGPNLGQHPALHSLPCHPKVARRRKLKCRQRRQRLAKPLL